MLSSTVGLRCVHDRMMGVTVEAPGIPRPSGLSGAAISVSRDRPFWLLGAMYGILVSDAEMMSTGFRAEPDACLAVKQRSSSSGSCLKGVSAMLDQVLATLRVFPGGRSGPTVARRYSG